MAKELNKMQLTGRLGSDPEIKRLEKGSVVANFSIATDDSYKDKNGNMVKRTEWTNVTAWGTLAENIEKYLKKGNRVLVEGKKQTRSWEDKDKKVNYSVELLLENLIFLENKKEGEVASTNNAQTSAQTSSINKTAREEAPAQKAVVANFSDDDLPF